MLPFFFRDRNPIRAPSSRKQTFALLGQGRDTQKIARPGAPALPSFLKPEAGATVSSHQRQLSILVSILKMAEMEAPPPPQGVGEGVGTVN